jgi:hypothetical protein
MSQVNLSQRGAKQFVFQTRQRRGHIAIRRSKSLIHRLPIVFSVRTEFRVLILVSRSSVSADMVCYS